MKNKSIIVFGAGRFGESLATELFKGGMEVMLVDKSYDIIQSVADKVTTAVQCDVLDENAMEELGISNFEVAVIAIGSNLEASIIATLTAKDFGVKKIISKANSEMQARILKKIGADQIIYPEIDMGYRLAKSIVGSNFMEYIHFSKEYSLVEIKALPEWEDKSLSEIDFRKKYNLNVVAFRREGETIVSPNPYEKIEKDDIMILIGDEKYINKLERHD